MLEENKHEWDLLLCKLRKTVAMNNAFYTQKIRMDIKHFRGIKVDHEVKFVQTETAGARVTYTRFDLHLALFTAQNKIIF